MVNSGTLALWLAVDLLECERGDEVITSPLTFSSDIAPLVRSGIVPVFVDVDVRTYQVDPDGIEEMISPWTKAILVPNLVGNCPDWIVSGRSPTGTRFGWSRTAATSWARGLRGTPTGRRSDISVTSFARSHAITAAGNGGLIGVDDERSLDLTLMRRRWGRRSETYLFGSRSGESERFGPLADGTPYDLIFVFDEMGYNFEPSEIMAAYGLVQLDKLQEFNRRRQGAVDAIDHALAKHDGAVVRPETTAEVETTWMRYPFVLDEGVDRVGVQEYFEGHGIATRMVWTGNILRQPGFAGIEHRQPNGGLPNCDRVMDRALSLPTHHALTSDDVGRIVQAIADWRP